MADFSELPRPTGRDATAANAPLVAAADRDLDSYLEARGDADIFFATDLFGFQMGFHVYWVK